jgi:pseudouridine-5'-phosphate glycosidase
MSGGSVRDRLDVADEVAAALTAGLPVVALESTLISHGLPYPQNVEVARGAEAAIRAGGAVPATVAIRDGRVIVGLAAGDIEALAAAKGVIKAARPNLASALVAGGWAATTVSATMIAAHAARIRVFATGGIGGVHRGALDGGGHRVLSAWSRHSTGSLVGRGLSAPTFDISPDLEELARTPVVVVCAGPKAILDVPATIEYLETRGVPVIVVGSDTVPGFFARSSGVPAPQSVADVRAAGDIVAAHLALGLGSGALVCVPVSVEAALPDDEARGAVDQAVAEAAARGIHGPATTPWLLARVAELTNGASVRANTALIVHNAGVAAELAVRLGATRT